MSDATEALRYAKSGLDLAYDAIRKGLYDEALLHCGHHAARIDMALASPPNGAERDAPNVGKSGKLPTFPSWRPIETAPRDATAVLVMCDIWPGTTSGRAEECNGHNTYVAEWWSKETPGPYGNGASGRWVCYMDRIEEPSCPVEPTHWMPLPNPPVDAALTP